jgi:N-acetylglutamate synthase-like GNAT family acetyltransferase
MKIKIFSKKHKVFSPNIYQAIKKEAQNGLMLDHSEEEILEKITIGAGCICTKNGVFVGSMYLEFWENKYIELYALIVSPRFRKKGFGGEIFEATKKLAKKISQKNKAEIIVLGNNVSAKMAEKTGFQEIPKTSLDKILWAPCPKSCEEWQNFPHCHCQSLILRE